MAVAERREIIHRRATITTKSCRVRRDAKPGHPIEAAIEGCRQDAVKRAVLTHRWHAVDHIEAFGRPLDKSRHRIRKVLRQITNDDDVADTMVEANDRRDIFAMALTERVALDILEFGLQYGN